MSDASPLPVVWRGGVFVPATSHQLKRCAEQFTEGQRYAFMEYQPRNMPRHAALFAQLNEAWSQLPEGMADDFPTQDHLRSLALIKTGWHNRTTIVAANPDEAAKLAMMMRSRNEFCIVLLKDATVDFYEPKSQAVRAMKDADFVKSMNDVLDYASGLIGISRETLNTHAGMSA